MVIVCNNQKDVQLSGRFIFYLYLCSCFHNNFIRVNKAPFVPIDNKGGILLCSLLMVTSAVEAERSLAPRGWLCLVVSNPF